MLVKDDNELGEILVANNYITRELLNESLSARQVDEKTLEEWLIEKEILSHDQIIEAIAHNLGFEFLKVSEFTFDPKLIEKVDAFLAQQYEFVPIVEEAGALKIAIADPLNLKALDDLTIILEQPVEAVVGDPEEIREAISEHFGASAAALDEMFDDIEDLEVVGEGNDDPDSDADDASQAPIIKLVNMVLLKALQDGASDIHWEPFEKEFRLRFRVDGVCRQEKSPPKKLQGAILSRLKIMSGMDISEKRVPQDGRIKITMMGKEIDFRVNSLPCIHGESVVLRLLDKESVSLGLEQVGFIGDNKRTFDELIRKPNGILLVTGPTGSGKTTTLYSALNDINTPNRKLMTIENPVEYMLEGINQMQIMHEIGLDFSKGLRAMLRQSPDVIMVGEIRDNETASIAIRAALTGHLVFSTLHTNDAPSAITRLVDMGINPFLVASSIQAVMAQRLVRTICSKCKEPDNPGEKTLTDLEFPEELLKNATFFKGAGCEECNFTGYKGRSGIFELMVMTQELKDLVLENVPSLVLRKAAIKSGMRTLRNDGFLKVSQGMTTVVEVARVARAEKS